MPDFANPRHRNLFFSIHRGLPREAPGNQDCTLRALCMTNVPTQIRVLDIGCGTGPHTLDLAQALPAAHLIALDAHSPYLSDLRAHAQQAGFPARIETVLGDMRALPFKDQSFDLLWCEAAVYIIGFVSALMDWQRLIKRGGYLAVSDLVWITEKRPPDASAYWASYPDMTMIEQRRLQIKALGYDLCGDFVMPREAWIDEYYGPMQARIDALMVKHADDEEALAVLDDCATEIRLFESAGETYGYAFFVMRKC